MSFDSLLIHQLVIHRVGPALDEEGDPILDDYSQPVEGVASTFATVPGRIEGRTAKERTDAAQAGAVIGDYRAWIRPLPGLEESDWIVYDGRRYDILGIVDAGGVGHHLELDLKAVT